MADNFLPEEAVWEEGIRQVETTDTVLGGPGGVPNIAPKQLANRTAYLKKEIETVATNDDIDVQSMAVKYLKLPQLWRAFSGKIASQSEVDSGTIDDKYVTPKKLRWGFSFSISGTSGRIVFPTWLGGLMFQWGRTTISLSSGPSGGFYYGTASVNYSVTFPNDVLWFSPVPVNTGGIEGACSLGPILNANAQYYCHGTASTNMETRWFAIGY